ncbi:IucA/IucC family protein [Pseudalkalibacillus berkeleyi]|uniref:Siderophore synthetase component n=1 Tax=Pseudalkalibacillus berkeleyi TaxID=1069813 RepID=A0ABS9GXV1_9BACL|nr:IucA/IucC family protein [Pseudalkalibacillus berkeleyi]MCF6136428.1 hypothetical protein [Pseudalkalibacillus berkeleyi]
MTTILKDDPLKLADYGTEVLAHLQTDFPYLVDAYHANLKHAEKTILHQLIQAILREKIVDIEWENVDSSSQMSAAIKLNKEEQIIVPIKKLYTLKHIDIDGEILYSDRLGEKSTIINPDQLLTLLIVNGIAVTFDNIEQFCNEITNSTYNYALALTSAEHRQKFIKVDASNIEASNTIEYIQRKQQLHQNYSPLTFFEQWVIQGHTIHPCSRTRLGLSPNDVTGFAPEWEGQPSVVPVAVHKDHCRLTHHDTHSTTQIIFDEYPTVKRAFYETLENNQLEPSQFELIPVHPWQLEHTIRKFYKQELNSNVIIPIEDTSIETGALISFRSLAPLNSLTNHHIKTAINVQMTSAVRTVSAASTKNGPVISEVLRTIQNDDSFLSNALSFMRESAGIHYEPEDPESPEERHFLQKNLASILRENPEKTLEEGEIAIPAAALIAESPVTQQLILEELVRTYAGHNALKIEDAAVDYIEKYANVLLPGVLTLITKYGISMEVHLQNSVCVFRNGLPERMIVRDNGGIRIHEERLKAFMTFDDLDNSTNLITTEREPLIEIFFHAIIHNHLGEMIVALSRALEMSEERLWASVKNVIDHVYIALLRDASIPKENFEDQQLVFSEQSRLKALVKMRLTDKFTENAYVDVANPLFSKDEVFTK